MSLLLPDLSDEFSGIDSGYQQNSSQSIPVYNGNTPGTLNPDGSLTPLSSLPQGDGSNSSLIPSSISNLATAAKTAAMKTINPFSGLFDGYSITDGIFILLGIILIIAGLFSFKTTQTIIQNTGKVAGYATKIVAAASA